MSGKEVTRKLAQYLIFILENRLRLVLPTKLRWCSDVFLKRDFEPPPFLNWLLMENFQHPNAVCFKTFRIFFTGSLQTAFISSGVQSLH